jgi:ABC-2 type transport system ATP-binding protein
VRSAQVPDRSYLIETFDLQTDLKRLLDWADAHAVELLGLSAAPTRLDDVFRALDADPTSSSSSSS